MYPLAGIIFKTVRICGQSRSGGRDNLAERGKWNRRYVKAVKGALGASVTASSPVAAESDFLSLTVAIRLRLGYFKPSVATAR